MPPRLEIECRKSGDDVHVPLLLLGLPPTERDEIRSALARLEEHGAAIGERLDELAGDQQRMFLKLQQGIQSSLETKCPSVFAVTSVRQIKVVGRNRYELHLYCEEPGSWHRLPDGQGVYGIAESPQWLRRMTPYLQTLLVVLKHAAPLVGPVLGVAVEHLGEQLKADVELMSALVDEIPDFDLARKEKEPRDRDFEGEAHMPIERASSEADFRALEKLLTEIDPERTWGGLSRVNTPEGLTLYLCRDHAAPYSRNR
jgi:internalin A